MSRCVTNKGSSKAKNDKERHMEIEEEISMGVSHGNEVQDILAPCQSAQLSPARTAAFYLSDRNGYANGISVVSLDLACGTVTCRQSVAFGGPCASTVSRV